MLLEDLLAPIFPGLAMRRLQQRAAFEAARAMYDGARVTRRNRGWITHAGSANAETRGALHRLRNRARDLVRNNPHASTGLSLLVAYQVGSGIIARSATGDTTLDKQADKLWNAWCRDTGYYSKQALAARARSEGGEALIHFRPLTSAETRRRPSGVPLDLAVLEADYIDTYREGRLPNGNVIHQGVEINPATGERVNYWMFPQHPGDVGVLALRGFSSDPVPASEVLHLYREDRPGQMRGVPDLAVVMTALRMHADADDAMLEALRIQACLAAFVTTPASSGAGPFSGTKDPETGNVRKTLAPGMIERLRPGEEVEFGTPPASTGGGQFSRYTLQTIAAGLGLTYDLLTGDLTGANYSSLRAGRLAFRRRLLEMQWNMFVPRLCDPVWDRFIAAAQLAGLLPPLSLNPAARWPVKHSPPRFELLDPQAEFNGMRDGIRSGLITWKNAVAELGEDPREQVAEIAETNEEWDENGVILDCDPRRVSIVGQAQDPKQLAKIELMATPPKEPVGEDA